ncbi:MAG: alpha/beta fold hydrolase [Actinobacteria bacterium]|nr:alpha/beta fold hydrolase [Actinomycetota bacterium]
MADARFFTDTGFEFATLIAIGAAPYGLSEAGEVLSTAARISDGDADSWFDEWTATGGRCLDQAGECEAAGHVVSAKWLYLRASFYLGTAFFYVLATRDPSRELQAWRRHRAAFAQAMDLWDTPVQAVEIPYEDTPLQGYFFSGGDGSRPLLIATNGSDGTMADMLGAGVLDAVDRGYHVLIYDGPGQGAALYEDGLPFRHDWEKVVTPIVDWAAPRADVDVDHIALCGWSQAGYWVPRAAAFEPRLAAIMVDPGVVSVGESWTRHLPPPLLQLLDAGKMEEFDAYMAEGMKENPGIALEAAKRLEPYRTDSLAEVLIELRTWDLTDVAGRITAPTWISSPDDEQFWPGQSQRLFDLLTGVARKVLVPFTAEDGANWHCEPMAPRIRAQRMYDWLDETLAA